MTVGYYKTIYCALDININDIISFLIDYADNSDIEFDCKEDKYTAILDNMEDWLNFYLDDTYPELDGSLQNYSLILGQIKDYLQKNLLAEL